MWKWTQVKDSCRQQNIETDTTIVLNHRRCKLTFLLVLLADELVIPAIFWLRV